MIAIAATASRSPSRTGRRPRPTSSSAPTGSTRSSAARCGASSRSAISDCTSWAATCSSTDRRPMTRSSCTTARRRAATRRSATRASGATSGGCSRRSIRASRSRRTSTNSRGARPPLRGPAAAAGRADAARAPPALGDPRPQAAQAVVQGPGDARRRRRPPHLPLRRLRRRHVDRGRLLPRLRARASRPPRQRRGQDARCRPSRSAASRTPSR